MEYKSTNLLHFLSLPSLEGLDPFFTLRNRSAPIQILVMNLLPVQIVSNQVQMTHELTKHQGLRERKYLL